MSDEVPRSKVVLLSAACVLAFLGLGITMAHLAWPSPLRFTLFVVFGQGAFAVAIALYLVVILWDLRRKKVL
jgi:hypothetical protein